MLFVWAGAALAVLTIPGGGIPVRLGTLVTVDTLWTTWLPGGARDPDRHRRGDLDADPHARAPGSRSTRSARTATPRTSPASTSRATRIVAYALSGTFAALGGLALTAASGLGDPHSGDIYTLNSVAAVVLGGVSLLGGVGGLVGPIAAAFVLTLVKTILIIKGVDQNWAQVIQGAIIVGVMMVGGLAIRQKGKTGRMSAVARRPRAASGRTSGGCSATTRRSCSRSCSSGCS